MFLFQFHRPFLANARASFATAGGLPASSAALAGFHIATIFSTLKFGPQNEQADETRNSGCSGPDVCGPRRDDRQMGGQARSRGTRGDSRNLQARVGDFDQSSTPWPNEEPGSSPQAPGEGPAATGLAASIITDVVHAFAGGMLGWAGSALVGFGEFRVGVASIALGFGLVALSGLRSVGHILVWGDRR